MLLDVLPLPGGRARLVRVYGDEPCITLPEFLPAADEGQTLAITELGDYCFAEKPRSMPGSAELCRYAADEAGEAVLITSFGHSVAGGSRGRCAFFDDGAEHAVCGNFAEEITLPKSLRVVGSCAFYNCRRLRSLSFGSGGLALGSDVFLNCFALEKLIIRACPEESTGLFALVNNISEAVSAIFWPEGHDEPRACFWYPAYWEDIEETPAHILLHTFSGQGYHYRQCFGDGRLLPAEYDAIFAEGHAAEDADVMAALCFERLRLPWALGGEAAAAYREFLAANSGLLVSRLLKAQDTDALRALLALDVMNPAALAEACALAARADSAAAAALLADAEHAKRARAPKKPRYDFDF